MSPLFMAQILSLLTALGFAAGDTAVHRALRTSTPVTGILTLSVITLVIYGPIALMTYPLGEIGFQGSGGMCQTCAEHWPNTGRKHSTEWLYNGLWHMPDRMHTHTSTYISTVRMTSRMSVSLIGFAGCRMDLCADICVNQASP